MTTRFLTTDQNGNVVFNQTYGGEMAETTRVIIESDGGYVIAAHTASFGEGKNDFWLIKTDENGIIPEFPSWIILPLFLIETLAITVCRKKMKKGS